MRITAWAVVVGLGITGPAQALMCGIPFDPVTGSAAMPGDAGFDSAAYGRLIYSAFPRSFDAADKVVLVGTLTPRWSEDQPLLHEVLAEQQEKAIEGSYDPDLPDDAFHAERVNVTFSYDQALNFSGSQITAAGLIAIPEGPIDYVFHIYEELYQDSPSDWDSPRVFTADIDRTYGDRITVHSQPPCAVALPAPDAVALSVLTACIANKGCL